MHVCSALHNGLIELNWSIFQAVHQIAMDKFVGIQPIEIGQVRYCRQHRFECIICIDFVVVNVIKMIVWILWLQVHNFDATWSLVQWHKIECELCSYQYYQFYNFHHGFWDIWSGFTKIFIIFWRSIWNIKLHLGWTIKIKFWSKLCT